MQTRRVIATIAAASAFGLAAGALTPAAGAQDGDVRQAAGPAAPAMGIVGLGDSYMSGEGVMTSNKHFKGSSPSGDWTHWALAPGPYGGNLLASGGGLNAGAAQVKVWGSVFGDKNGWPEVTTSSPVGQETIPFCDRSFAAPMFIGGGFAGKNLACSGAIVDSVVNEEKEGGLFGFGGTAFKVLKPGIDFQTISAPGQSTPGQAKLLQDYAAQQKAAGAPVKVVALSIGGNDFGFAEIATDCITSATLDFGSRGNFCNPSDSKEVAKATAGVAKAEAAVRKAVTNVATAMRDAGYAPADWTLVYQPPPLPIPEGDQVQWNYASDRGPNGGCVLPDATFDWIAKDVYPSLVEAMTSGLKSARTALGDTNVILFDHSRTFVGHRLCEKGTKGATGYADQHGRTVPWRDDNGIQTEWVNEVNRQIQTISGNKYQKSEALHPNYWGQRALADCMAKAVATVYGTRAQPGARQVGCIQASQVAQRNPAGRPNMKLGAPSPLWFTAVGQPTITGAPHPGQTLSAGATGAFAPAPDAGDLSYEWQRDGTPIPGATGATYQPVTGDVGAKIAVKVSAARPGVAGASATSQPVAVSDLRMTAAPAVVGTPKVGEPLTVTPGTYDPAPDGARTYQWLADGQPVAGATGTTYTPTVDDVTKRITVQETASKASYSDVTTKSAPSAPVAPAALTVTGQPTISGKAQVGEDLTADIGTVQFGQPVDSMHFEWFRNGKIIAGADQQTYTLTGKDVGKQITTRVIGFKAGYTSAETGDSAAVRSTPIAGGAPSATSPATAPVATAPNPHGDTTDAHRDTNTPHSAPAAGGGGGGPAAGAAQLQQPTIVDRTRDHQHRVLKGRKIRYGTTAEVSLWHVFEYHPSNPKVTWFRKKGKKVAKLKHEGLTWQPRIKDIGSQVHAEITTRDKGYEAHTVDTAWYPVVKGKRATVRPPKIRNLDAPRQKKVSPAVGSPLKASKAKFAPGGKVKYQWYAGSGKITGATGRKYTPARSVVGKKLRVKATMKATAGYKKAKAFSELTKKTAR